MSRYLLFPLLLAAFLPAQAQQQQRMGGRDNQEILLAVVPYTGVGTFEDPKRPLFTPARAEVSRLDAGGTGQPQILSFTFEVSDDGRFALVEFRAADRKAFAPILNSGRSDVKAFERGKATKEEIESEFRKHKKDFDANKFAERPR